MKIFAKYIAAALAAFSFVGFCEAQAQVFPFRKRAASEGKSRKVLFEENKRLRSRIDSLLQEIEALKDTIAYESAVGSVDPEAGPLLEGVAPETYSQEVRDSLLDVWYASRGDEEDEQYDMDSVKFSSNVPDKVFLERIKAMNSYITLPYNETVRNYILLYSDKMPDKMSKMLALSDYYFPVFEAILDKYGMPQELKYMAVIESALNPTAVSRAGAKGMWQYMYTTARNYGLTINSFVDERLDPYKSADAAARYLYDAYKIFGDWNLAISSYNCGAGNVNKAIRRCGGNHDFWSVYDYLPRETRGYVPAFVGAMYAFNYYKEHGIVPENLHMPAHVDTFKVHKMLHFQQIKDLTGISVEELRAYNPQYIHDIIPGNEKEYILRLPIRYSGKFIDAGDSLYSHRAKELFNPATLQNIAASGDGNRIVYRVKNGDYLGRIAARYHVSVSQIKRWNGLRNNNLRIGQRLVIYRRGVPPATTPVSSSKASSNASTSAASSSKVTASGSQPSGDVSQTSSKVMPASQSAAKGTYYEHTIKAGETLYQIAKNYPGVSADDIMKYNGISSRIKPGMKIRIPKR